MPARRWLVLAALAAAGPAAAAAPEGRTAPDDSEVLAEGPLKVTIDRAPADGSPVVRDEEAVLLFLTREALYVRYPKTREVAVFPADREHRPRGRVVNVRSAEAVHQPALGRPAVARWFRDDKAAPPRYDGPALARPRPDYSPLPDPTPSEVDWFLFHALERLQVRTDAALAAEDDRLTDAAAARAREVEKYMAAGGQDREVRAQYAALPAYIAAQRGYRQELRELFLAQQKEREEAYARARANQARAQAAQALGFLQMLTSAIPEVREYEYPDGSIRREERYDFGGVASGLGTVAQAQHNYAAEAYRQKLAAEAFAADAKATNDRLVKALADGREARARGIRQVGKARFGLPEATPLDLLGGARKAADRAKDLGPVIDLYQERAVRDKGDGKRDNPYALWDLYDIQARVVLDAERRWAALRSARGPAAAGDRPDTGGALFALSAKAVEAVRLVPPGEVFDADRADLLRGAASLACLAAVAEADGGSWMAAFSPRAAAAVRLLDPAGPAGPADLTGEVREQRAVALMLTGRADDALAEALTVSDLRDRAAGFHLTLARLYAANRNVGRQDAHKAVEALARAFALGYSDVAAVRGNPDYLNISGYKNKAGKFLLRDLLTARISARVDGGKVVVTNASAFTITNVRLHVQPAAQVGKGKRAVAAAVPAVVVPGLPVPLLRPGGEFVVDAPLVPAGVTLTGGRVTLTASDQQRKDDTPTALFVP